MPIDFSALPKPAPVRWADTPDGQATFDDAGRTSLRVADCLGKPLIFLAASPVTVHDYDALRCIVCLADDKGGYAELGDDGEPVEHTMLVFQSVLRKQLSGWFAAHTEPLAASITNIRSKSDREYYSLS